jgi:hypothetical protein
LDMLKILSSWCKSSLMQLFEEPLSYLMIDDDSHFVTATSQYIIIYIIQYYNTHISNYHDLTPWLKAKWEGID